MKKIVFITPKSLANIGGGEKVLCHVANMLVGYADVTVISLYGNNSTYRYDNRVHLVNMGKAYCKSSILRKIHLIISLYKLHSFLKTNVYDILIAFSTIGAIIFSLAGCLRGVTNFCWLHTSYYQPLPIILSNFRNKSLQKYDGIISINEIDTQLYSKINKVYKIYNPVDLKDVPNIKNREKVMLSVGRLSKDKGFDRLIKICTPVLKDNPEWKLFIYGQDDGEKNYLINLIHELNMVEQIQIFEPIDNIEDIYLSSSIFVFASHYEAFSLALLEAFGYGLPVIAFDVPSSIKEMITDNHNGFIIPDNNDNEYILKLKSLVNSETERIRMGVNGIEYSKKFNSRTIIKDWLSKVIYL